MALAEARFSIGFVMASDERPRGKAHPQLFFPNNRSTIWLPRSNPSVVNQIDLFLFTGFADDACSYNRLMSLKSKPFRALPLSELKAVNKASAASSVFG